MERCFFHQQERVLFNVLIRNGLSQRRKDRKVMDERDEFLNALGWHRHWSVDQFFGERDVFGPVPVCAAQEEVKVTGLLC